MVAQVAWADDENGSDADLKRLLEPTVVISPTLYDGFAADRDKSSGDATLTATKNTMDLRSAALGAFADYFFEEEEELKRKYDGDDRIKAFLANEDAWKRVRGLERKVRARNQAGYFNSSKMRNELLAKRKRNEDEAWRKGELDCNHKSIGNTVMSDHDMFRIGEAAILQRVCGAKFGRFSKRLVQIVRVQRRALVATRDRHPRHEIHRCRSHGSRATRSSRYVLWRTTSSRLTRAVDGLQRKRAKSGVIRPIVGSFATREFGSPRKSGDVRALCLGARDTDPVWHG